MTTIIVFVAGVLRWFHSMFRRMICLAVGHKTVLQFEPQRLALRCIDCGYQTPGWPIGTFTSDQLNTQGQPPSTAARDRAACAHAAGDVRELPQKGLLP